jgi:hypothetical protein
MTHPTPNDAMKDIERLIGALIDAALDRNLHEDTDKPRATLLAAIGKLVASTQPAMSQDAQPVGYASAQALRNMRAGIQETATIVPKEEAHEDDGDIPLYTHPPIPQEGKVMEALESAYAALRNWMIARPTDCDDLDKRAMDGLRKARALLRSQVQGGLSTNTHAQQEGKE